MSPGKVTTRIELFATLIISSLLIDNSSWSRELITKLYPALANSIAIASPIPLLHPVMTALCVQLYHGLKRNKL